MCYVVRNFLPWKRGEKNTPEICPPETDKKEKNSDLIILGEATPTSYHSAGANYSSFYGTYSLDPPSGTWTWHRSQEQYAKKWVTGRDAEIEKRKTFQI